MGELPGALHTYVWEVSSADPIELHLIVPVGPVHEKEREAGAAYALFHLVQLSSGRHSPEELATFYQEIGHNPWADFRGEHLDHLPFRLRIPLDKAHLMPRALEIMADWLWGWSPDPAQYEELARREAGPLPPLETLVEFYNTTFLSLPAAVIAAGDFDGEATEQLIGSAFATPPASDLGPVSLPVHRSISPAQWKVTLGLLSEQEGVTRMSVNLLMPTAIPLPLEPRQFVAIALLSYHLRHHLGQQLGWSDTQQGSIRGGIGSPTRSCLFYGLSFKCTGDQFLPFMEALERELGRIQRGEVSEKELGPILSELDLEVRELLSQLPPVQYADDSTGHFLGTQFLPTPANIAAIYRVLATIESDQLQRFTEGLVPLSQSWLKISAKGGEGSIEELQGLITALAEQLGVASLDDEE
ncbi:MAG: insulinase family protein [Parachlamydiales bacterium]